MAFSSESASGENSFQSRLGSPPPPPPPDYPPTTPSHTSATPVPPDFRNGSNVSTSLDVEAEAATQEFPDGVDVRELVPELLVLGSSTNYLKWNEQIIDVIEKHQMQGFISGDSKKPYLMASNEYKEWKESDDLLKGWIFATISKDIIESVRHLETAEQVWKAIWEEYVAGQNNPDEGNQITDEVLEASSPTIFTGLSPLDIDIEEEETMNLSKYYRKLYKAALRGNWEETQMIFRLDPNAVTANVNGHGYTALHIAIGIGSNGIHFIKNLLNIREVKDSLMIMATNKEKFTTLHYAAIVGNLKAAKILVKASPDLLYQSDSQAYLPLHRALLNYQKETFQYLLGVTEENEKHDSFRGKEGVALLSSVIHAEYFDVALYLLAKYPELGRGQPHEGFNAPLEALAKKAHAFPSGIQLGWFESFIYKCVPVKLKNYYSENTTHEGDIEDNKSQVPRQPTVNKTKHGTTNCFDSVPRGIRNIRDKKLTGRQVVVLTKCLCKEIIALDLPRSYQAYFKDPIIQAAHNGAYEVVEEIISVYPQAIWYKSQEKQGYIFQIAIMARHEKVYNLIYQMSGFAHFFKMLKNDSGENLLHLAAYLSSEEKINQVSGAALQMQRELQWFQELEKFVDPRCKSERNHHDNTPEMLFMFAHKEMLKDGEQWIKTAAESYIITAGLITTIVFAAAITVPGGNGNSGEPNFADDKAFHVFAVADATSLFASTTSLLLFLSILTARYSKEDLLKTLPTLLMLGLAALFLSTLSMMVAFSATLYLMFGQGKRWVLIMIAAMACLPVTSFVTLQFPLLANLYSSTYGPGLFGKQSDTLLY